MKILILYWSSTGNTEKVARRIADTLSIKGKIFEIVKVEEQLSGADQYRKLSTKYKLVSGSRSAVFLQRIRNAVLKLKSGRKKITEQTERILCL